MKKANPVTLPCQPGALPCGACTSPGTFEANPRSLATASARPKVGAGRLRGGSGRGHDVPHPPTVPTDLQHEGGSTLSDFDGDPRPARGLDVHEDAAGRAF